MRLGAGQAIIWTDAALVNCHIHASLGLDELNCKFEESE